MNKKLIVIKFGGTSLGDIKRIKNAANIIKKEVKAGKNVIVVVSAIGKTTDDLQKLINNFNVNADIKEIDSILSSGEQISSGLMVLALNNIGVKSRSFLGWQIPIITNTNYGKARILDINANFLKKTLQKGITPVIAGFQGISEELRVSTIGRGGSDTTAVAIASKMSAQRCDIYTDVEGVYTTDPRLVKKARKIKHLTYDEMLEMASLGAKVLQLRCVEFAHKFQMPLVVKSSYIEGSKGTLICEEDSNMEQPLVSGIMYDKNQAKITLKEVPDQPGIAANIFEPIAAAGLSVDMIIQNISAKGHTDLSFTLGREELDEAMLIMDKVAKKIRAGNVSADSKISKISIVGAGMRSHSGVAARIFKSLSKEKINILMISTSEIKVSCIIEQKHTKVAVNVLHKAFELDIKPNAIKRIKKQKFSGQNKSTVKKK